MERSTKHVGIHKSGALAEDLGWGYEIGGHPYVGSVLGGFNHRDG